MHMFFRIIVICCATLPASVGCDTAANVATKPQQNAASPESRAVEPVEGPKTDAQRIADVHAIARLVEEFKQKTGHYPYEEAFLNPEPGFAAVPTSVNISSQPLPEQYRYPPPGRSGVVYSREEFLAYFEKELGKVVTLPSDSAPPPRLYQYQFDGRNYFVSAVLLEATPDTRQLAPEWHKYEVGSVAVPERRIRRFSDIK